MQNIQTKQNKTNQHNGTQARTAANCSNIVDEIQKFSNLIEYLLCTLTACTLAEKLTAN